MKIRVHEVPSAGLTLQEQRTAAEWDIERPDVHFAAPLLVQATVQRDGDKILIEGRVSGAYSGECARCLAEVQVPLSRKFSFYVPVQGVKEIDISEAAREEVMLGYPVRLLCRQKCRGLCPQCGRNRNTEKCSCA